MCFEPNFNDFESVIVDDWSIDNSKRIIEAYMRKDALARAFSTKAKTACARYLYVGCDIKLASWVFFFERKGLHLLKAHFGIKVSIYSLMLF